MGNGLNEPVEFTRGDAERLKGIETKHDHTYRKLDNLCKKFDLFLSAHITEREDIKKSIYKNSLFRRTVVWVFSTSAGVSLLALAAKAAGWLN